MVSSLADPAGVPRLGLREARTRTTPQLAPRRVTPRTDTEPVDDEGTTDSEARASASTSAATVLEPLEPLRGRIGRPTGWPGRTWNHGGYRMLAFGIVALGAVASALILRFGGRPSSGTLRSSSDDPSPVTSAVSFASALPMSPPPVVAPGVTEAVPSPVGVTQTSARTAPAAVALPPIAPAAPVAKRPEGAHAAGPPTPPSVRGNSASRSPTAPSSAETTAPPRVSSAVPPTPPPARTAPPAAAPTRTGQPEFIQTL
jgi:hypothetical protein